MSVPIHSGKKRTAFAALAFLAILIIVGSVWFADRYDDRPQHAVALFGFSPEAYPENPEETSRVDGAYPHRQLIIEQLDATRFRFLLQPAGPQAAPVELADVDLAHFVAAIPP